MAVQKKPFSKSYRKELKSLTRSLRIWRDNHIIYGDLRSSEDRSVSILLNQISKRLGRDYLDHQVWKRY